MSSTTYERRKAQGVCPTCPTPVADGHVYCAACRNDKRVYWQATYPPMLTRLRQTHDEYTCPQCRAVTAAEVQTRQRLQDWWDMGTGQPVRERARR